jgi:hypothetical protein
MSYRFHITLKTEEVQFAPLTGSVDEGTREREKGVLKVLPKEPEEPSLQNSCNPLFERIA